MAQDTITVFAETNFRNQRRKFGVKRDDRRRHMYVVGKTGMGKSTLLENMIIADIRAGEGVAVVDPHGDLAEKILDYIPSGRINDVIYFNPSDTAYPIAFNILESVGPDYKHLVAYGLVGVFKKIWADSWGPRMEYIMTNTILALLDYPGSTLLGMMRMLVDKAYRKKVVSKVSDPVVKTFWADEYANYSEKFRTEAIAPIQNKVGQFLASAIIRNIVGQSKSTIEMREIMDNRKILIMNLAKGRIGEENSALLGAMMITKLQIAAMSRVNIPESERKDFFLYVDEFQNFATDSFAGILSEARKYRLCLIMAHQYFEQLGDVVKAAVFGNVGTMIVFRVGAGDAAELELEFAPQFQPADIVNLKKYTFCIRLMVDGVATEPFSAIGLPPASGATNTRDKVVKVSRERYARPQSLVEDRIIRWSGVEVNRPEGAVADLPPDAAASDDVGEEVGDDMDWPDPVGAQPEPVVEPTPAQPELVPSSGVQLETAVDTAASRVDAAGFIPGDRPEVPRLRQGFGGQASSKIQIPKEEVQPTVHVEPEPVAQPMIGPRPKISFVNHPPQDIGIAENPEQKIENAEAVETMIDDTSSESVETRHGVSQKNVEDEIDIQPQSSMQEEWKPTPPPASVGQTVSLADLKQGNVQAVKFGPNQSVRAIHELPQQPDGSEEQRRKRKRKRKRGGGGGQGQIPNGQMSNSNQQSQQSRPPQAQQPRPQQPPQPQPSRPQQPRPQPQSPKPQQPAPPKPAQPDPNKVSWGDLLQ